MCWETYYCESCLKDGLTQDETIADTIGGIFCSEKCLKEFHRECKQIKVNKNARRNV
jgi:hypothetical protein